MTLLDSTGGISTVDFELLSSATVDASWSCGGEFIGPEAGPSQFRRIWLLENSGADPVIVFQSVGNGKTVCSFHGALPMGRYPIEAESDLRSGDDFPLTQLAATETASYTMTLTFP